MTTAEQQYQDAIFAWLKAGSDPKDEPKPPTSIGFRKAMTIRAEAMLLFRKLEGAKS